MDKKGLSTLQTLLWKGIRIFGIVILTSGMFPNSAMAATTYDLTALGSSADINGATFLQFDPIDSGGTGNFDPFVRIQATGTEKGYNTEGVLEFDEKTGIWTHSLLLSAIPSVYIDGVWYREFQVDINEVDSKSYLSLNELQIFTAASKTLTGYDAGTPPYPGGTDPSIGAATTLVYNLDAYDDATVDFNYALQSGSGWADYLLLVPDDDFNEPDPRCRFGGIDCPTYVYFYSNFGDPFTSSDGFEEWAVSVGTALMDPPEFTVTKWVYDYTDKVFKETGGWDFSATVEIDDPVEAVDDYYWFNPVAGLASGPLGTTQSDTTAVGTPAFWSWWPGTLSHPKSLDSVLSFYEVPQAPYVFVGAQCTRTSPDGLTTTTLELKDAAGNPYIGNLTAGSPAYVFYGADGIADRSSKVHCDVYNNKPTAVTMSSFTASPEIRTILVQWQTIVQTDTLGFNLYRSLYENGERELLGYIPVKIPDGGGAEYEYLDDEVLPGKTYYYWLEAVDINGSSEVFDPVAATWWWKSYVPMITR